MEAKEELKIIKLRLELEEKTHKMKMDYAKYIRETEKLKHEWELERGRIKSAEIRRTQERKYWNSQN